MSEIYKDAVVFGATILSIMTFSLTKQISILVCLVYMLSVIFAECRNKPIMLCVIRLSVVRLNVIMLSVMAPFLTSFLK